MTSLGLNHGAAPDAANPAAVSSSVMNNVDDGADNPLDAFDSEGPGSEPAPAPVSHHATSPAQPKSWWRLLAAGFGVGALAVAAIAQASVTATRALEASAAPGTPPGLVYVDTEPSGVEVWIDGKAAGLTPARLSFPNGQGVIELRHEGIVRMLPITVAPGQLVRQRVEFVGVPPTDLSPVLIPPPAMNAAATVAAETPALPIPAASPSRTAGAVAEPPQEVDLPDEDAAPVPAARALGNTVAALP